MSVELKNAYIGQPASTGTTLYTCPTATTARVVKCTATNDTTTATTLTTNKIPSGGAEGDDNLIMNTQAIGGNKTYECPEVVGQVLDTGDAIKMTAGADNQVTVSLDVVEIVQ